MEMSRAWADDSNDVSHLSISHLEGTEKVCDGGSVVQIKTDLEIER